MIIHNCGTEDRDTMNLTTVNDNQLEYGYPDYSHDYSQFKVE